MLQHKDMLLNMILLCLICNWNIQLFFLTREMKPVRGTKNEIKLQNKDHQTQCIILACDEFLIWIFSCKLIMKLPVEREDMMTSGSVYVCMECCGVWLTSIHVIFFLIFSIFPIIFPFNKFMSRHLFCLSYLQCQIHVKI